MDYAAIKDELSSPEYNGMTADEKRQHYNNKMVSVPQRVDLEKLHTYLFENGIMDGIEARKADSSDAPAQTAARKVWRLFGPYSHMNSVDVTKVPFSQGLDVLVNIGDITAGHRDAITAMGAPDLVHVSRTKPGLPRYLLTRQVEKAMG